MVADEALRSFARPHWANGAIADCSNLGQNKRCAHYLDPKKRSRRQLPRPRPDVRLHGPGWWISDASTSGTGGSADHSGLIICSRPFLLTSFRDVLVPRARIWTFVGFASPPRLTPDPSSLAPI